MKKAETPEVQHGGAREGAGRAKIYDEPRSKKLVTLNDKTWEYLTNLAAGLKISRNALIEKMLDPDK
jgi:hypothetical protein